MIHFPSIYSDFFVWRSPWPFDVRSSINVDRPIKVYHMTATCPLLQASKMARTNGRLTRGRWFHVDQSGDTTCQFLPHGMLSRLQNGVDQWAIDTCHMCHVAVRPTPVRTSPGVVGALPVIPFGALNRNPSNPTACRGKWRIKHFRETKNLDSIRETAETQKLQIWRGNRTFSQFIISTWHILIGRSTFTKLWSNGHQYAKFEKKVTNWAGICWHVACPATKKLNKISRFAIEHFTTKAKLADFRPMFHAEPAGIRSWSSEPVVIRSRRLEIWT